MTIALIVVIVALFATLLLSICVSGAAGYLTHRTIVKNFEMQDRQKEYNRFHTIILDSLEEDTQFLKTEFVKRISLDVPETRALSGAINKFQNRLEIIRATLKEYKMLDE